WAASLTMGAGQFCTNPGIAIVKDGSDADRFTAAMKQALSQIGQQTMLTDGIAEAYRRGQAKFASHADVTPVIVTTSSERSALPNLFEMSGDDFICNHALHEEVFGPLGLVVRVKSIEEMERIAADFEGQLTATIHMDAADVTDAKRLVPVLERRAGRLIVNGFPTGVEVVDSMVHGGPYPASTNFGATSVGTMSIRRFLRPVSYQNFPQELLPEDLG
ncbi:MAG: aldehyde dehydrogenase family protein, partial [Planctomycetaceae bacterium]|nr:aldehyde dehydrogenase family protein [Planctomycetaceae bacterium]